MPVPKKRVGKSDKRIRRACWKAFLPSRSNCPHCGTARLSHCMCTACGYYNGKIMSEKLHVHHEH
jgi:large subunit ribosomal protein L32